MPGRTLLVGLLEQIRVVSGRWLTVGIFVAVGLGLGACTVLLTPPQYEGSSTVTVAFADIDEVGKSDRDLLISYRQLRTFAEVVDRPQITQAVIDELELPTRPSELAERLDARLEPNSHLIEIIATDTDPETAGAIAGTAGKLLADSVEELHNSQVTATASNVASISGTPVSPSVGQALLIGLFVGFVAGLGGVIGLERLDPRIRTVPTLAEATGVPNLAVISHDSSAELEPTILRLRPTVQRCEEFRQLRGSLQFVDRGRPQRRLLVTSAEPDEGRTTTACNLALTMARAGQRVALVECDFVAPRLADYLGLDDRAGLTGVLIGRDEPETVLQRIDATGQGAPDGSGVLDVMVAGAGASSAPTELLRSRAMELILRELEQRVDVILLDAPAISFGSETASLAFRCDATLLVVRHGHSTLGAVRSAVADVTVVTKPAGSSRASSSRAAPSKTTSSREIRLLGTVLVMAPAAGGTGETSTEHPAATVAPISAAVGAHSYGMAATTGLGAAERTPTGRTPAGQASAGQAPAGQPSAGQASSGRRVGGRRIRNDPTPDVPRRRPGGHRRKH